MQRPASKIAASKRIVKSSFPAIPVKQSLGKHFWISSIPAKILYDISKVSRAEEDPKKGYQRLLDSKRAKRIARYFDEGGIIPGSIVLSAQPEAELEFNTKTQSISFRKIKGAFIVIDGQHRLYGAGSAQHDLELPVAIFSGLSLEEEVQYFIDVNGEQKGVPRTLRLEIIKFLTPEEHPDQIRINLFHELNTRPDSPLCNRMSPTRSIVGKISHVAFNSAVRPVLDLPAIKRMNFEQKARLLVNFLSALESLIVEAHGDSKKLSNAAFFQAVFDAFPFILQLAMEKHGDYKRESFADVIEPMKEMDFAAHSGTNKKDISALSHYIKDLLSRSDSVSNELF